LSRILVIEDNDTMREGMVAVINKMGYETQEANNGKTGLKLALESPFDLIITDYKMEGLDGLEVLKQIKQKSNDSEVIIVTAYGTIDLAIQAMKEGAADLITKPFSHDELQVKVEKTLGRIQERRELARVSEENVYLREELECRLNFGEIVGESPQMKEVYGTVAKVSKTDSSVLIYGESGTGKELIARAIHRASNRRVRPFIRVHCGALAEGVLESELFGHERGAFTGATRRKRGRFELAHTGSIFLDEIGDIPAATQLKLLRAIQEKEFERVGGEETLDVDVRIIAATNRDLMTLVNNGSFRQDLYYRLHIIPVTIPPLRERPDDIPELARHFIMKLSQELNKPNLKLSTDTLRSLSEYPWPGNVRELENILERAAVLAEDNCIKSTDLATFLSGAVSENIDTTNYNNLELTPLLERIEKEYLKKALEKANGVKTETARLLGIKTSALYYKLEKYGLL